MLNLHLRSALLIAVFTCIAFATQAAVYYFDNRTAKFETVCAYVWGDNGTVGPAWPGTQISLKEGSNCIYQFECSESIAGIIFNNNDNGSKTEDLTPSDGSVYTKTDAKGSTGTPYETYMQEHPETNPDPDPDPDPNPDPEPTAEYYIYFTNDKNWATPYVWAWNSSDSCVNAKDYPGDAMTKQDNGLWYWAAPSGKIPTNLVISNGGKNDADKAGGGNLDFVNKATYAADGTTNGGTITDGKIGAFQSYTDAEGTVTITAESGKLLITPYSKSIVKIFTLPESASGKQERKSIAVVENPEPVYYNIVEDDNTLLIEIENGIKVSVNKENCLVSFQNRYGTEQLAEKTGLINIPGKISMQFEPMQESAFYGGGYTGNNANRNNKTITLDNTQKWGYSIDDNPHNINIPFIISTNGYGLYFDSQYRGATITPSSDNGTKYSSASPSPISYYYIGGGSMENVINNYIDLTGHQMLPPMWAFGYITSKYSFKSREEAETAVNETKKANLPLDAIVFDIDWQGSTSKMGELNWGSKYKNPAEMMANFNKQHIKTIAITEPYFSSECSNYSYLANKPDYLATKSQSGMSWVSGTVGLLDCTNPAALDWYWKLYKARTDEGIEGWWLDLGEPEQHDDNCTHKGGTVAEVHNEFGNLWTESVFNGMRNDFPGRRVFLMPRSGTAGMQRFSTFPWTGDIQRSWAGLQAQVPSLINGSMSGIGYLGSDMGGFAANAGFDTNGELYVRWVEFCTFSPMTRSHSQTEPEAYKYDTEKIGKLLNMRYSYLPYIYTLAHKFTTNGTPMCLPPNFYDEDPSILADEKTEYLVGRDLLVAPVLTENTSSRTVNFPEGKWIDLNNTKNIYEKSTTVSAPLGTLPHFARLGAIIPRYAADTYTSTAEIDRSKLRIDYYHDPSADPTKGSDAYMYEDDWTTPDPITEGKYYMWCMHTEWPDGYLTFDLYKYGEGYEGCPETHNLFITVHNYSMPESSVIPDNDTDNDVIPYAEGDYDVSKNGMTKYTSLDDLKAGTANGYYNDSANNRVYLNLNLPAESNITVNLGSKGIETGINALESSSLHLAYADGVMSYRVSDNADIASIELYSATGMLADSFSGLAADGVTHQMPLNLQPGVYIARLAAEGDTGKAVRTAKFIVR